MLIIGYVVKDVRRPDQEQPVPHLVFFTFFVSDCVSRGT